MINLNPEQQKAVKHTEGPLLVIAGAGSGKTRVISYRVINIVNKGTPLDNILVVTFTNKAANEMKSRTFKLLNMPMSKVNQNKIWIGTFHSIGLKLLKQYHKHVDLPSYFAIYDDSDQAQVIKELTEEYSSPDLKDVIVRSQISLLKNNGYDFETFIESGLDVGDILNISSFDEVKYDKMFKEIYCGYSKFLKRSNALDFDDLLLKTQQLLSCSDVLTELQNKFQYIMVDEYQDTNEVQYNIVKSLSDTHKRICVVGDDNQAIYSWRGATIEKILQFDSDFPNATTIKLEQNYRSTQIILKASNAVIKNNSIGHQKKLWSANPPGHKVIHFTYRTSEVEAASIVEMISIFRQRNIGPIAILYRMNHQSRTFEQKLISNKIPYALIGGTKFYDRMEIRDVLAYLKLSNNNQDEISFKRIINVPKRAIGKFTLSKIQTYGEENAISSFESIKTEDFFKNHLSSKMQKNVVKFLQIMKNIEEAKTLEDKVTIILQEALLDFYYKEEKRIKNLNEMLNISNSMQDSTIQEFLDFVSLNDSLDALNEDKVQDKVLLMTLHKAKGLEFDTVFLVGCEEGTFPTQRAIDAGFENIEEERRLCYVGMTRAMKRLMMSTCKTRRHWKRLVHLERSRFIEEIPEEYIDFRVLEG